MWIWLLGLGRAVAEQEVACAGRLGSVPTPLLHPLPLPRLSSRPIFPGARQLTLVEGGSFIQENLREKPKTNPKSDEKQLLPPLCCWSSRPAPRPEGTADPRAPSP